VAALLSLGPHAVESLGAMAEQIASDAPEPERDAAPQPRRVGGWVNAWR
jgi:hypothetical protein